MSDEDGLEFRFKLTEAQKQSEKVAITIRKVISIKLHNNAKTGFYESTVTAHSKPENVKPIPNRLSWLSKHVWFVRVR